MPEYLTVKEASELIRTPVATLYQWSYRHEGPPVRNIGRRLLYPRDQLVAWVDAQVKSKPDDAA